MSEQLKRTTELDLRKLARRFAFMYGTFEYDDLLQECQISAWIAAQDWQADGGSSLRKWVYHKALLRMLALHGKEWKRRRLCRIVSYDAFTTSEHTRLLAKSDFAGMVVACVGEMQERRAGEAMARFEREAHIKRLAEARAAQGFKRRLEILRMMTSEEKSQQQVAAILGTSESSVSNTLHRLYENLGVGGLIPAYNEAMRRGLIDPPKREIGN